MNPDSPQTYNDRASAYFYLADYENALSDMIAAIKLDAKNPHYFENRAEIYAKLGDAEKARADRAKATSLAPKANASPSDDDTTEASDQSSNSVTLSHLIQAGMLRPGEKISFTWKPRGGERQSFEGTITANGEIEFLGQRFTSPSNAAIQALQSAGSSRPSANGWTTWKTASGALLSDLRSDYLASQRRAQS